ncbi:MAG: hypothetical protein ACD_11C00029G0010 [uncultured bacterium]|nr:MAG: hypothetical protein ACD_11C00029G0010 [uncultured bacterium]HBR71838.1 adenylate kinase [Candidatus Moranbacteria bacterium]
MNVVILGPQGSGKGTQAHILAEEFKLAHIEMGLLLRNIAKENSDLGREIDAIVNNKKELAPDEIVYSVLREAIEKVPKDSGIIFDGVPRRLEQIENVEKILSEYGRKIDAVIYIALPFEESIERITKRFGCVSCGAHLIMKEDVHSSEDKCPKCGGQISQRKDDTLEGITKRLNIFYKDTIPVIEYYRKNNLLYEVDGKRNVESVYLDISEKAKSYL